MIRKSEKPLHQFVNRISENNLGMATGPILKTLNLKQEHSDGPLPQSRTRFRQYRVLNYNNLNIRINSADCYFQMNNNAIVKIRNILSLSNEICLVCQMFQNTTSFFTYPCDSALLGIYLINIDDLEQEFCFFNLADMKVKVTFLPYHNNFAVICPLLHY